MTLKAAIDSIVSSRTNDACKRIGMGGFFFRSSVSTEVGSQGNFTLTFRKREDENDEPVDFVYSYDALHGKWTAPENKPDLSGELFGEFLGDDWIVGTYEAFEAARNPEDDDEW